MKAKYSLIIRWSDEDRCYIAWVPELGTGVKTHGATYSAAAKAGAEVIEMMIERENELLEPLPAPWLSPENNDADEELGRRLFPANPAYQPPRRKRLSSKHATT